MISNEQKKTTKRILKGFKIKHAAIAKLYYADSITNEWSFSDVHGVVALFKKEDGYYIGIVDVGLCDSGKNLEYEGVLWMERIHKDMRFCKIKPRFQTFESHTSPVKQIEGGSRSEDKPCLAGLSFKDESSAQEFYKKTIEKSDLQSRTDECIQNISISTAAEPSEVKSNENNLSEQLVMPKINGLPSGATPSPFILGSMPSNTFSSYRTTHSSNTASSLDSETTAPRADSSSSKLALSQSYLLSKLPTMSSLKTMGSLLTKVTHSQNEEVNPLAEDPQPAKVAPSVRSTVSLPRTLPTLPPPPLPSTGFLERKLSLQSSKTHISPLIDFRERNLSLQPPQQSKRIPPPLPEKPKKTNLFQNSKVPPALPPMNRFIPVNNSSTLPVAAKEQERKDELPKSVSLSDSLTSKSLQTPSLPVMLSKEAKLEKPLSPSIQPPPNFINTQHVEHVRPPPPPPPTEPNASLIQPDITRGTHADFTASNRAAGGFEQLKEEETIKTSSNEEAEEDALGTLGDAELVNNLAAALRNRMNAMQSDNESDDEDEW